MPTNQIVDPQAESTEFAEAAHFDSLYQATGAITKGMIVQLLTTYPETTGVPAKVKKATTTENFLIIGVASNTAATGTLVRVVTYGPAKVLLYTTVGSTKAQVVVQTTANAGYGHSTGTAVLGKTVGVWMQTSTAGATKRLAWAYINHM